MLMAFFGAPFEQPIVRAIARFAFFAIPAYIVMVKLEPKSADPCGILTNAKTGLIVGIVVSVVWAAEFINNVT